jgi:antitoxin component of MazEF toxin-antitoxin module
MREDYMLASIQKLEDTEVVCLPETIMKQLFLHENDQIDITTENGSIIIRKAARKRRALKGLDERFEGYSGDYKCFEANTGKPVGMEVW